MGKRHGNKGSSRVAGQTIQGSSEGEGKPRNLKLSPQKRNELNQLVDKLLKVTSALPASQNAAKSWETHLEIDKLLNKIIILESDLSQYLPSRNEESMNRLTKWMKDNGSKINGVKISDFGQQGYGLEVIKDLPENDLVISVPRKLMISTELADMSPLSGLCSTDPMLQHMPNIVLSLVVLMERFNMDSFWSPFIQMLPTVYNTVMWFTPADLKELKGSPVFEPALKQCKNIARQYAYFYNLFQKSSDPGALLLRDVFTYEHYRWAVSTVMTRQNFIPSSSAENRMVNALIPFWDMSNHTNAKMSTDYTVESEESVCYACRGFQKGEQFFISYGSRPNSELLLHNGFALEGNTNDNYTLQLGVSKSDPLREERSALLNLLSLPLTGQFLINQDPKRPLSPQLHAFLRVFSMNKEQLDKWISSENVLDLKKEDCDLEAEVENKTCEFLKTRIKLLLLAYPTKLEDDQKLYSNPGEISACHHLALLQRITEMKILIKALNYVQDRSILIS